MNKGIWWRPPLVLALVMLPFSLAPPPTDHHSFMTLLSGFVMGFACGITVLRS